MLTPIKPVPKTWFPGLKGAKVLALASGGGQQGPILAAAGALVMVFDNSPSQLAQDKLVAERDGLSSHLVEGDIVLERYFIQKVIRPFLNKGGCFYEYIQSS